MQPAQEGVEIREWPGLITNVDPRDIPPGAAEIQVNATVVVPAELQVRLGLREVTFEG